MYAEMGLPKTSFTNKGKVKSEEKFELSWTLGAGLRLLDEVPRDCGARVKLMSKAGLERFWMTQI